MKKIKKFPSNSFENDLQRHLKNLEFKKMFDEYGRQFEVAYSMLQIRKRKKMSQAVLAKKIGTTQSNVARMEAGNQNFTYKMLVKIAEALDKRLDIQFK